MKRHVLRQALNARAYADEAGLGPMHRMALSMVLRMYGASLGDVGPMVQARLASESQRLLRGLGVLTNTNIPVLMQGPRGTPRGRRRWKEIPVPARGREQDETGDSEPGNGTAA